MNIKGVIFDLDGLMIDSERFHFDAMAVLVSRYGKNHDEAWFEPMVGMDNIACAKFVIAETNIPLTPDAYIKENYDVILEFLPEFCQPNPGLLDLIDDLIDSEMMLGVASNSYQPYVNEALSSLGILEHFNCILTAGDVPNAKPAPDLYLAAADCLGLEPNQCIALEDSAVGMTAALQAGILCAVIPSPHIDQSLFKEATFTFPSLEAFRQSLPLVLNTSTTHLTMK